MPKGRRKQTGLTKVQTAGFFDVSITEILGVVLTLIGVISKTGMGLSTFPAPPGATSSAYYIDPGWLLIFAGMLLLLSAAFATRTIRRRRARTKN